MARRNSARNILFILFLYSTSSMLFARPVSVEQVRRAVDTFLKAQNIRQEKELKAFAIRAGRKALLKAFTPAGVKDIRGEEGKVLAYITELEPEGYVITAADSDMGPILGYSFKGKFPFEESKQNVLLHLVQWDVEARLRALSSPTQEAKTAVQTNNKCWEKYIASEEGLILTLSEPTQWPDPMEYGHEGWIQTHWDQGGHWEDPCNTPTDPLDDIWVETHYDDKCPLLQIGQTGRCAVGCVATAMAQIINYWKYPGKVQFDSSPWWLGGNAYTSQGNAGTINIDVDAMTRDFPTFSELNSALSTINYDGDPIEQAYLCFAVGAATGMYYGSESFTKLPLFAYKKDFYYGSADYGWDPTGVLWNLLWKQNVIENVKKGWPVQIGIEKFLVGQGHSVIVDGYKSTGEFHINCGWASRGDFWYTLPIIDTNEAPFPGNHYYDLISEIICNISSYQGWSQWGADEKNSFGTVYTYPTEEPDLKWEVTVPSGLTRYKFDYIVVGTGNKIYASLSPRDLGQGNCPYVAVINPHGYIEGEPIPITDSDYDIDYLTQNHRGEIFFGSSEYVNKTSIYRIDPKTEAVTRIFDHTSPDGGHFDQPIKVDQDDCLYFLVTPRYTANSAKFYCINRSGSVLMSHTFSPEIKFYRSVAAIDEARNHVYLNYYNESEDKSYLVCFNRSLGLTSWTHAFPGTHTASEMAGAPAVGEDGTIYIGCFTTLYALSPANGNEIWSQDFYPAYAMRTPAIGRDGTLYVNYGKMIGSVWHPGFVRALDPADGTIRWEREISPPLETFDNMGDIYAAGNGMVGFTYNKSGIAHIGGLIDQGDSGEILWDVEYGGKMIFGPGQTIYVVSSTADASSIYALSVGERGDPDGLAMGFTDNEPPAIPSSPTPARATENVDYSATLSWDCNDPESHTLQYSLFVGESGYDMVPVATDVNDTSYMLEELKPNTGYAWKIIATDGQAATEGPTWVFATRSPNPDLSGDRLVNFIDFAILGRRWMDTCSEPNWCERCDFDGSEQVDFADLYFLADNWLVSFFSDDFENIAVDDYPDENGWRNMFSGKTAYVTDEQAHGGEKTFRLEGYSNWSRHDYVNVSPLPAKVIYEACIRLTDSAKGGGVGFLEKFANMGPKFNALVFQSDNRISFYGPDYDILLHSWEVDRWYKVHVEIDFTSEEADATITDLETNDIFSWESLRAYPIEFTNPGYGSITLDNFGVFTENFDSSLGGTDVVYFDDVKFLGG